jgi:hypothetical protein
MNDRSGAAPVRVFESGAILTLDVALVVMRQEVVS